MRILLALGAMSVATAALAQSAPAPAGDKPPAQATPKAAVSNSKSIAERLQACLKIDDGTKPRLDCFDAVLPPQPKSNPATAKNPKKVMDCRFLKEEDERLACFNGFTEQIPKFTH
ncbi:MAG: hypothetical protein E7813_11915 [Bradyrhizobium sp.]|uniref:hypothetical protein n=1 Tax=Bradyrhizobium sp. TaxID=376 RepID=UPI001223ABC3|nr:hypothetical protein [Bradyrhizobium sp.]THD67246.1 MAG: hypothetical protein E7813_11915 [Bradyrhizobium sp.]